MKTNKYYCFLLIFAVIFSVSGCKDETVTPNNNNNNNQDPTSPQLLEPANNVTLTNDTPLLKWNAFANTSSYRIQVSIDANFLGTIILDSTLNSTELSIRGGLLIPVVNHYWRVIANLNGGGTSNWSAVWRFSVLLPPPAPPNLLLPANSSVNQSFTPFFDWDDPPTATTYRLQISSNPGFTSLLYDTSGINISEKQCPPMVLNTNTQYYWRVNASNSNGFSTSDWSAVFNFTTINGPEPNSISGRITFADNNFVSPPNFYVASAYYTTVWPPFLNPPARTDSLLIKQSGNTYYADFKINGLLNGTYFVACSMDQSGIAGDIYGTYGCDTNRVIYSNCANNPTPVVISGNNGVEGINFLSWADSTKTIF